MIAGTAKRLDDLIVASVPEEPRRRIRLVRGVAAIDAVVVEDHRRYRQFVAADRLDLHAAETKGAVALDRDDGFAGHRGGANRITHADAHNAPRPAVEPVAGQAHIDDVAAEIERVGT